jgi:hypothetical protein
MSNHGMQEEDIVFSIESDLVKNFIRLYNRDIIYELLTEDEKVEYLKKIIHKKIMHNVISPNLRSSENAENDMVDFDL